MFEKLKKNWLLVTIGSVVIIILFLMNTDDHEEADIEFSSNTLLEDEEESAEQDGVIIVDVKGEVHKPGVYEIDSNARINDVIILAGGFLEEANETTVNLAQKVQDEMTIIVPKVGSAEEAIAEGSDGSGKIRINYATQAEVETLSGIGPSKAQAIIQHRDDFGFFQKPEDLLEISGIGEKTLENIQDSIQVP